ncbi:related to estradiol 17-beta-dehydrogenase 8 [Phialocephala subalpina]|uniref:Related to estradiol 17-beta-dehydrogenase 8 n=1 Tax=Phialocephala subalpina TaxID=576137 RepID=A0A1L7X994_9HELO|nr:related to estradiol 17-beta-dehydrogenase 8 [Phialocephala subalpina]
MSKSFEGKVIIITGAGSGIGRATAIKLSQQGAALALADINPPALDETLSLCTLGSHTASSFDVSSTTECNEFITTILKNHSKIDHIFNCAGRNPTSTPTADITDEYWDSLLNTNLKGTFNITRAAIPHLKSGASFVNVSSVCGLQPTAGFAAYCASKYAVIGFSKCIALELGPKGIRCNVVAPGYIDTPTNALVVAGKEAMEEQTKGVAMGRFGTAEEVADVVIFLFIGFEAVKKKVVIIQ